MSDPHLELMAYQQEAVSKSLAFLEKSKGFYNASDPGTGKTAMTLCTINHLPREDVCIPPKILVICPKIVKLVWKAEISTWSVWQPTAFTIINYEAARNPKILAELCKQKFDVLVLDECHRAKNRKSQIAGAILGKLWDTCKFHFCLSGTPMTRDIGDLWSIYSKFVPEFDNYWDFCNSFAHKKETPWGVQYFGVKNAEVLKKISTDRFLFRYRKSEVLDQLPEKVFTRVPLGPEYLVKETPQERADHEAWVKQLRVAIASGTRGRIIPPKSIQEKLTLQGLKKVDAIKKFVEEFACQNIPVCVFVYHNQVVEKLKEALKNYKVSVIYGPTKDSDRAQAISDFQAGITTIFIGSIPAAGLGITLTAASNVILGEYDYSPAMVAQAVDRVHRISQKNCVNVHYLVVENSVDEEIIDNLMSKVKTFAEVLD